MMTGQLSGLLVVLARRAATNSSLIRPLSTASGVPGRSGAPGGTKNSELKPLTDVTAKDVNPDDSEEALFSDENTFGLSPIEIARMRIVYGMVKEHAEVVENMLPPVDPSLNPLIDQRSFESLQTLPKLPEVALQQFRKELPAEDADAARALSTRAAWDPVGENAKKGQQTASEAELESLVGSRADAEAWEAVDERTMDPHYFLRMRRQIMQQAGARVSGGATSSMTMMRGAQPAVTPGAKRRCRLSDRRGRVSVDYREAATISDFLNDHGKIMHRRKTALSAKAQRKVSRAVKSARQMALLHPEPRPGLTLKEMQDMEDALE